MPANRAKADYGDGLKSFKQGEDLTPGIASIAAVGHTPGYTCFLLTSGSAKMLTMGDLIHIAPVQFARPEVTTTFDWEHPKRKQRAYKHEWPGCQRKYFDSCGAFAFSWLGRATQRRQVVCLPIPIVEIF